VFCFIVTFLVVFVFVSSFFVLLFFQILVTPTTWQGFSPYRSHASSLAPNSRRTSSLMIALSVTFAGGVATELPIKERLVPIMKTTWQTCMRTERRTGSSSPIGQDEVKEIIKRHVKEPFDLLCWPEHAPLCM
jgi:hypothetical protein